jgi:hypothetical protein
LKPATGQILRRVGLLFEALCLLGLISVQRDPQFRLQTFAGLNQVQYMKLGLGVGILLWVVGTLAIHWPRRSNNAK